MPDEYKFAKYPMWVHHPDGAHASVLVRDEDEESELLAKWDISHEAAEEVTDPLRQSLLERAARARVDVNPRWSDKRLKDAVEHAEHATKKSAD